MDGRESDEEEEWRRKKQGVTGKKEKRWKEVRTETL